MSLAKVLEERIFTRSTEADFNQLALDIYTYQYEHNPVYRAFCEQLKGPGYQPEDYTQIPHLPIRFFKSHRVVSGAHPVERVFESSGTGSSVRSKHYLLSESLYMRSCMQGFKSVYGEPSDYVIMALLPSYLERSNASLVYMTDALIQASNKPESGFYLDDLAGLAETLHRLNTTGTQTLLIGVSFALLDLAEKHHLALPHTTIIETGGMKGRRREWIRQELHDYLEDRFPGVHIHSEYGMTELLSQAYAIQKGRFTTPPWMKVDIREIEDPLSKSMPGRTGGVNIIDLANLYSCAFIATDDLGRKYEDGSFEILGRFDHSDIRGCNLMVL